MATVTPGYTFSSNEVVTPAKLTAAATPVVAVADDEITTAKILNAAVTTAKIADANVTSEKIADANVTSAKLANGAVTQEKLNSSVTLVPTGAVMPFAMNSAPSGWLPADGAEYSKTDIYANLFNAIGTIYGETNGSGAAGTTHFRVPDLRGYFVRGFGTNSDTTASGTFGTKQADEFKSHSHQVRQAGVSVGYFANAFGIGDGGTSIGYNTEATGGTETRPKNIALLYCIKF
jgi:microcystin-dependent protein